MIQPRDIGALAEVSCGNPQVIKLALGLVWGGAISLNDVIQQLRGIPGRAVHDNLLEALFASSWNLLSDDAKKVLFITTLLVGTSIIRLEALQAVSQLEPADFDRALEQLLDFKLIEPTYNCTFVTHSMTRAFARRKMEDRPELRKSIREAYVQYFLEFVKQHVRRDQPVPRYWNALVTDGMSNIDLEWPLIQAAIDWASDEELVEFVMLLVHYMDSRFHNQERIEYVSRAVSILAKSNRLYEEALLRIDALGWTFVEADRLKDALEQIERSINLVECASTGEQESDSPKSVLEETIGQVSVSLRTLTSSERSGWPGKHVF